jgi:hypothetical protein
MASGAARAEAEVEVAEVAEVAEGEETRETELRGEARRGPRILRSDYVHIACFCEAFVDRVA